MYFNTHSIKVILLINCMAFTWLPISNACSMYKVTDTDKTMVGCNHDAWGTQPVIWFEKASAELAYGACFTGSRMVAPNKFVPQSAMNEAGLAYSRLTAYHPKKEQNTEGKKQITNEVEYLSDILHQCATIADVKRYVSAYDRSFFMEDVFIYVDKSGDYLVVEPYELVEGNDPAYVLSNFCPSITNVQHARQIERYRNGADYLDNGALSTDLAYCRAVSDTMHVCRKRNGDGTLLTSIWNTQDGLVNLYFYHDFESTAQFNLQEELSKDNRLVHIPTLFPKNAEFERLKSYVTPYNTPPLRLGLVALGGFLCLLALIYTISFFRQLKHEVFNTTKLAFAGLNVFVTVFLAVIAITKNIFYFDAPYQHYNSPALSLTSYIPLILLGLALPLAYYSFQYIKGNPSSPWMKSTFVLNNLIYLFLIGGFGYWGFFDVVG